MENLKTTQEILCNGETVDDGKKHTCRHFHPLTRGLNNSKRMGKLHLHKRATKPHTRNRMHPAKLGTNPLGNVPWLQQARLEMVELTKRASQLTNKPPSKEKEKKLTVIILLVRFLLYREFSSIQFLCRE
jgi:hypothetical protein